MKFSLDGPVAGICFVSLEVCQFRVENSLPTTQAFNVESWLVDIGVTFLKCHYDISLTDEVKVGSYVF